MDDKTSAKIHQGAIPELVLLTGAGGFIGSRLLRELKKRKCAVHAVTWDEQVNPELLPNFVKKSQSKTLIHLAAKIGGWGLRKKNLLATAQALHIARLLGVERFVLVSSIKVLVKPAAEYARSKQLSEALVVGSGIPYAILRLGQVYGAGDTKNFETVKYWLTHCPVFPLPGGGRFRLQPVYIDDVMLALRRLMRIKKLPITVTLAGKPVSFRQLVWMMAKKLHRRVLLIPIPAWAPAVARENTVVPWKEGWKTLRLTALPITEGLQKWFYDKITKI